MFFNESLEDGMRCQPDAVLVGLLEDATESNEGLNIATGADNMDYYLENWGWLGLAAGRRW